MTEVDFQLTGPAASTPRLYHKGLKRLLMYYRSVLAETINNAHLSLSTDTCISDGALSIIAIGLLCLGSGEVIEY